jgi:hypothetical protein
MIRRAIGPSVLVVATVVETIGAEFRLSVAQGTLVVSQLDSNDKPVAEWRFRVAGTELKLIPTP